MQDAVELDISEGKRFGMASYADYQQVRIQFPLRQESIGLVRTVCPCADVTKSMYRFLYAMRSLAGA